MENLEHETKIKKLKEVCKNKNVEMPDYTKLNDNT